MMTESLPNGTAVAFVGSVHWSRTSSARRCSCVPTFDDHRESLKLEIDWRPLSPSTPMQNELPNRPSDIARSTTTPFVAESSQEPKALNSTWAISSALRKKFFGLGMASSRATEASQWKMNVDAVSPPSHKQGIASSCHGQRNTSEGPGNDLVSFRIWALPTTTLTRQECPPLGLTNRE